MKASPALKAAAAAIFALVLLGAPAVAQQLDSPVYRTVTMQSSVFASPTYPTTGAALFASLVDETGVNCTSNIVIDASNPLPAGTGFTSGPSSFVKLIPHKAYTLSISGGYFPEGSVVFRLLNPAGMRMLVDGVRTETAGRFVGGVTSSISYVYTIMLVPTGAGALGDVPGDLRGGEATSITVDKPIWYLGLGQLRSGASAGAVGFRRSGFANPSDPTDLVSFFTPATLSYDSPDPTEVDVVKTGGILRQVFSREVLVDVQTVSATSYRLDVYARAQVTGESGGLWTFAGLPFVSYTVSRLGSGSGVAIARTEDGITWDSNLTFSGATWQRRDWHTAGAPESYVSSTFTSATQVTVAHTGPGASGQETPLTSTKTFAAYPWGDELTATTVGALDAQYAYCSVSGSGGTYAGKLSSTSDTDGSWVRYEYYDSNLVDSAAAGAIKGVLKPWLNTSPLDPSGATTANSVYTAYTYFTHDPELPASALTTAPGGALLAKTTWTYSWGSTLNGSNVRTDTQSDFHTSTGSVTTVKKRYRATGDTPAYLHDKPISIALPDGRKDSYAYFEGSWNASSQTFSGSAGGEDRLILTFHGQTIAGSQSPAGVERSSWTNGYSREIDPLYLIAGRSTVSQVVIDTSGRTVFSGEALYSGPGSLVLLSGTLFTYDGHGRLTIEQDASRSAGTTTRTYQAALLQTVTGPDGVVTKYEYDPLLRPYRKTEGFGGTSAYPAKVHETVFDGANRRVETYACDCGTSPIRYSYDTSNRLQWKKEPSPNGGELTTSYAYPSPYITTTTLPAGQTSTEENYRDGRRKSISGTAQPAAYYDYTANSAGLLLTYYAAGSADRTNGWSETQADLLGRPKNYSTPAYGWNTSNSSAVIDIASAYDGSTGLLTSQTTTYRATAVKLVPDRLFTYDAAGRLETEGYNLDENTTLDPDWNDRIVVHSHGFAQDGGWWAVQTTASYPVLNSTSLVVTGEVKSRLTGFAATVIAETASVDANGRTATQVTSVSPSTKETTTTRTEAGVAAVQTTRNGYDYEVSTAAGDRMRRRYDLKGRLQYVDSRWNGSAYGATDTYSYFGDTSFVQSRTIGGVSTAYTYGWTGGKHTVTATDAVGTAYAVYDEMGLPWRTYGSGATPTQAVYDLRGRRQALTTWRIGAFETSWPDSPGTGDVTQWTPDPATGLVTRKTYANGSHVDFTYTALGQVKTRTWARGLVTVTTYDYYDGATSSISDVSHRTQELKSITYSDGTTPTVTHTYYRSGLPAGVDDATGARVFTYGTSYPYRLEKETLGSFYNRSGTARVRSFTYDGAGRGTGFKLGTASDDDVDLSQTLDYVATTGLVDHLYTAANNGAARTIAYAYETGSSLVDRYTTGSFAANYDYDATSAARRSVVEGAWSGSARTRFELAYDERGYLRSAKQSGSAFADYTSGTGYGSVYNFHTYDSRGQLQATAMYRNSPPASGSPAPADELPGRRFEYRYDLVGNRTTSGPAGSAAGGDDEYALKPNGLNQYDTRENNTVRVLGTAAVGANVGAQSEDTTTPATAPVALATNKKDRSFAADVLPLNNASGPAKGEVTVYAAIPGTGGAPDVLQTLPPPARGWQIAKQLQSFSYDADGNLEGDGIWNYQYDGENRLIRMESTSAAVNAELTHWVLEFKYDYMGRRVQKRSNNVTDGMDVYTRYVYDGWNVVAEFAATSTSTLSLIRSFTWGLDVAGTFGATGGVGALVQIADHQNSKTYFPTYDGSGNVSSLVDSADGGLAVVYEYSPFGEVLRAEINPAIVAGTGTYRYLAAQPFRFSTKWADAESGLVYYGYRYYSPGLGRFVNRDPIEESGGLNLYGFVGNAPTSRWDVLGLAHMEVHDGKLVWVRDPWDEEAVMLEKFEVTAGRMTSWNIVLNQENQRWFSEQARSVINEQMVTTAGSMRLLPLLPASTGKAPNKTGKQAPLDVLKKLCGTEAGRALVKQLASGETTVYDVANIPGGMKGFANASGVGNYWAPSMQQKYGNEIFLFTGNSARLTSFVQRNYGYRGSVTDFQIGTLLHETIHFAPPTLPSGSSRADEEAAVWQATDQRLPSYGLPGIFNLPSFSDYQNIVPSGKDVATGKPSGDSGMSLAPSDYNRLRSAGAALGGWDCSRVGK